MNRIIKFRAWDEKERRFFEPSSINFKDGFIWVCDAHGDNKLEYELVNPNGSLEQFTGLLDKNGKEIFEGDVIRVETEIWVDEKPIPRQRSIPLTVTWDKKGAWATMQYPLGRYVRHLLTQYKDVEVIGNIHENPELLK